MTGFASSVVKVLRGSVLAQAVAFAALPLLTRLFSPGDFGTAQAALTVVTVLLIVSALRLEVAVLSVPEKDVDHLLHCAFWLCVGTSGVALGIAALGVFMGGSWSPAQIGLALMLPVVGLLAGWNQLLSYLALRQRSFDSAANAKVAQSLSYCGAAAALGMWRPLGLTLVLADALGRLAGSVFLASTLQVGLQRFIRPPSMGLIGETLRRHAALATAGLIAALISAAGSSFTSVMLLWIFAAADAGQYAIVERFIGMPVGMMVAAISQVFMAHVSSSLVMNKRDEPIAIFRRLLLTQSVAGAVPALVLFLWGPSIVPLVFGGGWEQAGRFSQALAPLYFIAYVAGPANMALTVIGRQKLQLGWDVARVVAVAVMWGAVWFYSLDPLNAVWLYSIVTSLANVLYLFLADSALRSLSRQDAAA